MPRKYATIKKMGNLLSIIRRFKGGYTGSPYFHQKYLMFELKNIRKEK